MTRDQYLSLQWSVAADVTFVGLVVTFSLALVHDVPLLWVFVACFIVQCALATWLSIRVHSRVIAAFEAEEARGEAVRSR